MKLLVRFLEKGPLLLKTVEVRLSMAAMSFSVGSCIWTGAFWVLWVKDGVNELTLVGVSSTIMNSAIRYAVDARAVTSSMLVLASM